MCFSEQLKNELVALGRPEKVELFRMFIQAKKGGYGQEDEVLGVSVPEQRKVVKKYFDKVSLDEIEKIIRENTHEFRVTGLLMLVARFEKTKSIDERKEIFSLYMKNTHWINNWDLVDLSAHKIVGAYLYSTNNPQYLYELAKERHLWTQRIAIVATYYFIKNRIYEHTLEIALILMSHSHHIIHKAVGWMLREVGKKDYDVLFEFLKENYKTMSRTTLRYAIEKYPPELRSRFLKGTI